MDILVFVAIGFYWTGVFFTSEIIRDYRHNARLQAVGSNSEWSWLLVAVPLTALMFTMAGSALFYALR